MKTTASKLTAMLRRTAAALALTATAAAALVLPTSCKEEKKTDQEKKYVEGVIVPANNVSDCSMSEANITVTFETADAYTLEADKTEMITIAAGQEKGDAAGKHSVRVTISRNDTSDERTGQIFITVKGYNRTLLYQFVQSAGAEDAVVTWIDQRLSKEYYWLDEYNEKRSSFDFSLTYDKFLSSSLLQLTTNEMDGGRYSDGSRYIYSYIIRTGAAGTSSATRTAPKVTGLGLYLTNTVWSLDAQRVGFAVEHVYPGSPAEAAGIQRGDIISQVNGADITSSNMQQLWSNLNYNAYTQVSLHKINWWATDLEDENSQMDVTLTAAAYNENPVAYHGVLEMPESIADKPNKIGYLSYLSFDADYDADLETAMADLKAALLTEQTTNLGIRHLYIIATGNTASASELVISGLRGLDVPVTIVGARTEGKNCGMDVMVRTIDRYDYEFAPITFLNYNAKGFNEFSDGFEPDVDIATYFKDDANQSHVNNASMFPMPLAPWGMASYDIALMETMMRITGGTFKTETAEPAPAAVTRGLTPSRITLQQPERPGMTLTEQEREQIRQASAR